MALIIKGNIPTFCERLTEDGNNMEYCRFACVCESHNINTMVIPSDCPILGEIADNHGRLIDADKLKKELLEHGHPDTREWYYAEVDQFIDECPTVVEAST